MATSDQVPGRLPVAIDGRAYMADLKDYQRQSLDLFRSQADGGREFDEGSLSPEDLWRRSQVDWRMGAGVEFLDRGAVTDTARQRFFESEGIDPWVEGGKFQLHKDVTQSLARVGGLELAVTSAGIVAADVSTSAASGNFVRRGTPWSDIDDALPSDGRILAIDTDGDLLYVLYLGPSEVAASTGIWRLDPASPALTTAKINDVYGLGMAWARGRLMVWAGTELYNVTDLGSTTAPDPLASLPIGNWACVGATQGFILAGSNTATARATIHRITIREDGTALSAPVSCAELPDGEVIHTIKGYAGVVILGTSRGIRIGQMSGGELTYGPVVEAGTTHPWGVSALEPEGNYVWYRTYEGSRLGRMDLARFTDDLSPAYANDLRVSGSADYIGDVATYGQRRYFTTGAGVYVESDDYVATGSLTSGIVTFGVGDGKVVELINVKMEPLPAGTTIQVQVLSAEDDSVLLDSGVESTDGITEVSVSGTVTEFPDGVRYKIILGSDGTDTPVVTRVTLFANPIPRRGERIVLPLVLRTDVKDRNDHDVVMDPYAEFLALKAIERAGAPVDYQEFGQSYRAYIDAIQFGPELEYDRNGKPQGRCILSMRIFE